MGIIILVMGTIAALFVFLLIWGMVTGNWYKPITFGKNRVPLYRVGDIVILRGRVFGQIDSVSPHTNSNGKVILVEYRVCFCDPLSLNRLPYQIPIVPEEDLAPNSSHLLEIHTYATFLRDYYRAQYDAERNQSEIDRMVSAVQTNTLIEDMIKFMDSIGYIQERCDIPLTRHQIMDEES